MKGESEYRSNFSGAVRLFIILIALLSPLFTPKLTAQDHIEPRFILTMPQILSSTKIDKDTIEKDTIHPLFYLSFSKEQIVEKLKKLPENPTGYWSYWIYGCWDPLSISYICPKCGTKTHYNEPYWEWVRRLGEEKFIWNNSGYFEPDFFGLDSKNKVYEYIIQIKTFRAEVQKIESVHIALDESEFCKNCSPFTKNPILYLLTNIAGEADTIKTPNITWLDIRLLQELLNGNITHKEKSFSTPVSFSDAVKGIEYRERLKELLGIKDEIK